MRLLFVADGHSPIACNWIAHFVGGGPAGPPPAPPRRPPLAPVDRPSSARSSARPADPTRGDAGRSLSPSGTASAFGLGERFHPTRRSLAPHGARHTPGLAPRRRPPRRLPPRSSPRRRVGLPGGPARDGRARQRRRAP